MYKQRIAKPYKIVNGVKHTTFNIRNVPGVYIIYKKNTIIYVGFSGNNLYRTMYRHFQDWKKSKQYRAVYDPNDVKVRVIYCKTPIQAYRLEKALILKYDPIGNKHTYELFETDHYEKKELEKFEDSPVRPIIEFEDDIPF